MPNASPISLTVGAETVVLSPDSVGATHVLYQNVGRANQSERELLHFDRAVGKSQLRRDVRTNVPVTRVVNGVTVLKQVTFKTECVGPMDLTDAERAYAYDLHVEALKNSDVRKVFVVPEWVW